jgi:1,4-dihydroxy-2-naphthoate octaprenyltransferase
VSAPAAPPAATSPARPRLALGRGLGGDPPRTLSLAVTPVLLGSAMAWAEGAAAHWPSLLLALACALLIQIGTNLHNDVPPAAGRVRWWQLRRLADPAWPGVASLVAGWAYSGGPRPVSHTPLGEVFVLVFFGWVAVLGSYWLQGGHLSLNAWLCGTVLGLPAAAVLLVNNYRDLEDDLRSGRQTLVALLGRDEARIVFASMVLLPYALILVVAGRGQMGALLALLAMPYGIQLTRRLRHNTSASSLNALLAATARISLLLGVLLSIGVLL